MNKMGWLNSTSSHEEGELGGGETSDTQSSRSTSPNDGTTNPSASLAINSKTATSTQLISELSTMEATHHNQMHELTSQYMEESKNRERELQQCQNRVSSVERRIRERDAQMTALKEEKLFSKINIVGL